MSNDSLTRANTQPSSTRGGGIYFGAKVRFSIGAMLLLMFVGAVFIAGLAAMIRASQGSEFDRRLFFFIVLMGPMLLMMLANVLHFLSRILRKPRRPTRLELDDED
jgi:hypothetical protein